MRVFVVFCHSGKSGKSANIVCHVWLRIATSPFLPPPTHSPVPPKKTAARSGNARPASRKRQASNADEQLVKRTRQSTRQTALKKDQDDDDEQDDDVQDDDVQDEDEQDDVDGNETDDDKSDQVVAPSKRGEKKGCGLKKGPPTR